MDAEIFISSFCLLSGKLILYPTDTVWGIGCDATNAEAVAKLFALKQRDECKSLVVLVEDIEMLKEYVSKVPAKALKLIKEASKPITIIYQDPKALAKNAISQDNTVAIRIANDDFCRKLIGHFNKPIISTSANISGNATPGSFKEIEPSILEGVDYVVNLHRDKKSGPPSSIIKILKNGEIEVIRD